MISILLFLGLQGAPVQPSKILAVCGASSGKAFYVEPRVTGWVDDAISGGSVTLMIGSDGQPDVIVRDAMESSQLASASGSVVAPLIAEEIGSFIFVVLDREGNEVTTYQVSTDATGGRTLLWTDTKNHKTNANITKVAAYVASCERAAN